MNENTAVVAIQADGTQFTPAMQAIERLSTKTAETIERQFNQAANRGTDKLAKSTDVLGRSMQRLENYIVGGGIVYGMERMARGAVNTGMAFAGTAGSFEAMAISLNTVTQGQGVEWMQSLSEWARKMPVSTEEAVKSFIMMRAMGLQPTIRDMTTLVDTASAMGGGQDTMEGISRALGQIQTKGKVSAEELMQLAERGVPAYEILQQKLGLTAKQVQNIGNESIDGHKAVMALLSGMEERFGGQSARMQETYRGIISTLTDDWKLFQKAVMDGGAFEVVKDRLKDLDGFVNSLTERQRQRNDVKQIFGEEPEGKNWWDKALLGDKVPLTFLPNLSPLKLFMQLEVSSDQIARLEKFKQNPPFEAFQNLMEDPLGVKRAQRGIFAFDAKPQQPQMGVVVSEGAKPKSTPPVKRGTWLDSFEFAAMGLEMQNMVNTPMGDIKPYGLGQFSASSRAADLERQPEDGQRAEEISRQMQEQKIRNTLTGYEQERALAEQQYAWERETLVERYWERSSAVVALEQMHAETMIGIDKEMNDSMLNDSLAFGDKWGSMLISVVEQSGNSFDNIEKMFGQMMKKMATEAAVSGLMSGLFNLATGGVGGFAAGFMGSVKKVFGFRAEGGPVSAGQPYIVGEKRAELFVPRTSGYIYPSIGKMATGNTVVHDNSVLQVYLSPGEKLDPMTAKKFADMYRKMKRGE